MLQKILLQADVLLVEKLQYNQDQDQDHEPATVIVGDRQSGPGSEIQISESECRNAMFEPDDSGWSGWMSDSECKRLHNRVKYEVKPRNKEKRKKNSL